MFTRLLLLFDRVFEGEYFYDKITISEMADIMRNILEHLQDKKLRALISLFFLVELTDNELMEKYNLSEIRLNLWRDYLIFELQLLITPTARCEKGLELTFITDFS